MIATKPGRGRKSAMAPRTFQLFLNYRPAEGGKNLRNIIHSLYKDFSIASEAIPYFLMHVRAQPETYDLRLQADIRKFFFKPVLEQRVMEKLKSFLWSYFNKLSVQFENPTRFSLNNHDIESDYDDNEIEPDESVISSLIGRKITKDFLGEKILGPREKDAL